MSRSFVLVTREQMTQALLIAACERVPGLAGLYVEGDLDDDNAVEVGTSLGDDGSFFAMFQPREASREGASRYASRIGVAAPLGPQATCWLTEFSTPSELTRGQVSALVAVLTLLAAEQYGYVVSEGQLVALMGAPTPTRMPIDEAPPTPYPTLFLTANYAKSLPGTEGMEWLYQRVQELAGEHLLPDRIELLGGAEPIVLPDLVNTHQVTGETPQVLFRAVAPWARWDLDAARYPSDVYSTIDLSTAEDDQLAPALLESLLGTLTEGMEYAAITHWHDDDITSGGGGLDTDEHVLDGEPPRAFTITAHELRRWLPDLYWAQILGPPWVDLFGEDVLGTTPAHRCEEVAPHTWLLQLTPDLSDVTTNRKTYVRAREAAKRHLGLSRFFDPAVGELGSYQGAVLPDVAARGLL